MVIHAFRTNTIIEENKTLTYHTQAETRKLKHKCQSKYMYTQPHTHTVLYENMHGLRQRPSGA
jgi:hypothetical protein